MKQKRLHHLNSFKDVNHNFDKELSVKEFPEEDDDHKISNLLSIGDKITKPLDMSL